MSYSKELNAFVTATCCYVLFSNERYVKHELKISSTKMMSSNKDLLGLIKIELDIPMDEIKTVEFLQYLQFEFIEKISQSKYALLGTLNTTFCFVDEYLCVDYYFKFRK